MKPLPCRSALAALSLMGLCACGETRDFGAVPEIRPERAFALAEAQVKIGPRPSGSENARRTAEWIRETAGARNAEISVFEDDTPEGKKIFRNVIVTVPGKTDRFVIVGAHYDTKRLAAVPYFAGANDGASGTAALLAMIEALPERTELPFALRFVFFDGEEALVSYSDSDGLHGSRHYAAGLARSGEAEKCVAMILLDMVGDKDLNVRFPSDTEKKMLERAGRVARRLGDSGRFSPGGSEMLDDHVPFRKLGIPSIDLIDFEYGPDNAYWHTAQDTLEHISGESIAAAAGFALNLIWELAGEQ